MRPPALPALVAAAVLAGCSAVPGDLPAAADQRWEPLVTAPADAAQDSRSTAILPENLTRPSELPPDPRSFEPGGALDTI